MEEEDKKEGSYFSSISCSFQSSTTSSSYPSYYSFKSCLAFFELGTGVRFSRRAIFCCSLSGSWFENSEKTAHSYVKYQMYLSNALLTALETVLLYHVSCNHLNHATTVGHGGALVEAITLNRRVVGSTPALAAM